MDATRLKNLSLSTLLARVDGFCKNMDPAHLLNKFMAQSFSAELTRRFVAANMELRRPKQDVEIVNALNALVNWAVGLKK
jgi:hypothetical protein